MSVVGFVHRNTTFVAYKARRNDRCSLITDTRCRTLIKTGDSAFKPTNGSGGYTTRARLCAGCGQRIIAETSTDLGPPKK